MFIVVLATLLALVSASHPSTSHADRIRTLVRQATAASTISIKPDFHFPPDTLSCSDRADCGGTCICAEVVRNGEHSGNRVSYSYDKLAATATDCVNAGGNDEHSVQLGLNASTTVCAKSQCISTAWLEKHHLAHHTLGDSAVAHVLCLPGDALPCATDGHMLRRCLPNGLCNLVTYGELCKLRMDCTETEVAVSQLSHTYNWSSFTSEDGLLQLTSLSVHPQGGVWSSSRLVAHVANSLNYNGLGAISNSFAYLAHFNVYDSRDMLLGSESI